MVLCLRKGILHSLAISIACEIAMTIEKNKNALNPHVEVFKPLLKE